MKVLLQVDGGGILGITPAMVLAELEHRLRAERGSSGLLLRDRLDLCCGTSTGAIIAGFVAAGVDAAAIRRFYLEEGVRLFNSARNPALTRLIRPKFRREPFRRTLDEVLAGFSAANDAAILLGDLPARTAFMATAFNLCSHRTHFIKSTDAHDCSLPLRDVIAWSALSAAFYFGKIDVPGFCWNLADNAALPRIPPEPPERKRGAVFQDGGQGTQNCTLNYVLTEIFARGWETEEVVILSLGTGGKTPFDPYEKVSRIRDIGQTLRYLANQARAESTVVQKLAAEYVTARRANIRLFRLDYEAKENYDLDDTRHAAVYRQGAEQIIQSAVFNELCAALARSSG